MALNAPTGLTNTDTQIGNITFTFTDQNAGAAWHRLYRRTKSVGGNTWTPAGETNEKADTTIKDQDPRLAEATTYEYRLVAFDAAEISDWTAITEVTTLELTAATISLDSKSASEVVVAWSSGDTDADEFELHRSETTGFTHGAGTLINDAITPATTGTTTDSTVSASTTYYYKLVAKLDGYDDEPSNELSVTTDTDTTVGIARDDTIMSLWTDVEAAGGTAIRGIPLPVSGTMTLDVTGRDELEMTVPRETPWLDDIALKKVIRVETAFGGIYEWYISGMEDGAGGRGHFRITGDPISTILTDVGAIRDEQSGGLTNFNLGLANAALKQYLDTFVLPQLADQGISWVTRGTVDENPRFTRNWERWSPMKLVRWLEETSGLEFDFRRNGSTDWKLDFVDEINGALTKVTVADQRNLLKLMRERTREGLFTVIQPMGMKPASSDERSGIGFAAWEVTAIAVDTPVAGQDTVTLADRGGGDGPIIEDDQFVGNYVLKSDGTLTEILDSDYAAQQVVVADSTGLTVGDDVEIRADSSGTLMVELESPSGVAAAGRVAGTYEMDSARGERNYVPNPFASNWTTPGTSVHGLADGAQTATAGTITVKGLPANEAFAAGDVAWFSDGSNRQEITAAATADGSGNVTLTVSDNPSLADGETLNFFHLSPPDGWLEVNDTNTQRDTVITADSGESGDLSCQLDGAHSTDDIVNLKGLTEGDVILSGMWLDFAGTRRSITDGDVADASGLATVTIVGTHTGSDGDAVTVSRPSYAARTFSNVAVMPPGDAYRIALQTPTIGVKPVVGIDTMWVSVGITYRSMDGMDLTDGTIYRRPRIDLWDVDAGSSLASLLDEERTLAAESETDVTLRLSHELSGVKNLAVRVSGPYADSGQKDWTNTFHIRWVMLHIGAEAEVPPVWGSHATPLHQDGNRHLAERSSTQTVYDASVRELVHLFDADPSEPALQKGGTIRLHNDATGIDTDVRVMTVVYDLRHPGATQVVLDTRRTQLSEETQKLSAPPQFVEVNTTVTNNEVKQTASTSDEPPTTEGTRRGISDPDDDEGVVPIQTVPGSGGEF